VIGVALFARKESDDALRRHAKPFPGNDNSFALPPVCPRGE